MARTNLWDGEAGILAADVAAPGRAARCHRDCPDGEASKIDKSSFAVRTIPA